MSYDYEFIVIGGGSAGYAAANTAARSGLKTAVIDGSERLGGLCILRGCMPSKALIETANRVLAIREAEVFGIHVSSSQLHVKKVMDRKNRYIGEFAGYRGSQLENGPFTLIRGHASFVDSHTVSVTDAGGESRTITGATFCLAVGSRVFVPEVEGLQEAGFWTSDDILEAKELPESLIVLGGGAIALEMAHYAEAMGTTVTVLQRSPHLLSAFDDDVGETVLQGMAKRMAIHTGTKLEKVETVGADKVITYTDASATSCTVSAKEILVALGRIPLLEGLNGDKAGVTVRKGSIETNETKQTSAAHIFAAGDCCDTHQVVHTAIQHAEMATRNAARFLKMREDPWETIDRRLELTGIFTEPQAAVVGVGEKEAERLGLSIKTASYPFNDHGKSMLMGVEEGFVKLIAKADSGEIIGAAVVGPEATELIHEIVVAMYFRATAAQLAAIPHYHPTLSEIWTYPAEELA